MSYITTPVVVDGEEIILGDDKALRSPTQMTPIAGAMGSKAAPIRLTTDGVKTADSNVEDLLEAILKEVRTLNRAIAYLVDADFSEGND